MVRHAAGRIRDQSPALRKDYRRDSIIRRSKGAASRMLRAARAALIASLVHPAVCSHDRGGYSPGNQLSVELRGLMPLRPPAARFRQKRCGAALLLMLLPALLIGAGSARAADFMDAARRGVVLGGRGAGCRSSACARGWGLAAWRRPPAGCIPI